MTRSLEKPFAAVNSSSVKDAGLTYTRAGFFVVPFPLKRKGPRRRGWPDLRISEGGVPGYFAGDKNVGIITGIAGLTDADLDSGEALVTGGALLPPTDFVFGRSSKPASHFFYSAEPPFPSIQFRDPLADDKGGDGRRAMLVELRCAKQDGGIGFQTCAPPSIHPSGERVEFEPGRDGLPAKVAAQDLKRAASKTAAAALLARHWPSEGKRHDAFLALAGVLCRAGWTLDEAIRFHVAIYAALWPDAPDAQACAAEVESTFHRADGAGAITGIPRLCELLDERVVSAALGWLNIDHGARTAAPPGVADPTVRVTDLLENYVFDPDDEPAVEQVYFDGFIAQGDLGVWLGREKHRKTNLVLQCAVCAATGRDYLIFACRSGPVKVVVVDFETKSASLRQRLRGICTGLNLSEEEQQLLRENLCIIEVRKLLRAGKNLPKFGVKGGATFRDAEKILVRSEKFWHEFIEARPAALYIFDPMRAIHSENENDSAIEGLLVGLRQLFPNSAVIIAHHMRKYALGSKEVTLEQDMRLWSDGARGSTAIKAHADVIVCQERVTTAQGDETVYLGAFLKDGADIPPMPLEESDAETFFWVVRPDVPAHLNLSLHALKAAGTSFSSLSEVVRVLQEGGVKRPTAYRHAEQLVQRGFLQQADGRLSFSATAKVRAVSLAPDQDSRKR